MSYLNLNEDKRLKDYEFIASINGTESGTKLGYFDMNTREKDAVLLGGEKFSLETGEILK